MRENSPHAYIVERIYGFKELCKQRQRTDAVGIPYRTVQVWANTLGWRQRACE
jgi:hypothetical protein